MEITELTVHELKEKLAKKEITVQALSVILFLSGIQKKYFIKIVMKQARLRARY